VGCSAESVSSADIDNRVTVVDAVALEAVIGPSHLEPVSAKLDQ